MIVSPTCQFLTIPVVNLRFHGLVMAQWTHKISPDLPMKCIFFDVLCHIKEHAQKNESLNCADFGALVHVDKHFLCLFPKRMP